MTANVLVVDDLEPNTRLLEAKLLGEYYTVFTANSGKRALEILQDTKIDVILLDVMMPEMDGFETCRQIKINPDTMHIPIVMITALSDIEDRIKGLEAGADEFLTKPINDTPLFARMKSLSRMKSVIDELKLRNKTNSELGASIIEVNNNLSDSKILLINDDVLQTKNLSKMMEKLSPHIKVISGPDEVEALGEYIPELVIISCQLETGDPLRISMALKAQPNWGNTVLIMLAEEENMPMVIKGMDLGIHDYFLYPVEQNELLARLKTQLRRKRYQDNLRMQLEESVNLSTKDGLTNLFNRRYFDIHIKQMIKKTEGNNGFLSLLIVDIDDFKQVNDTYGHQAGDEVLKSLAQILKSIFRITDLIARYGGEEFCVLLSDSGIEESLKVAERCRTVVASNDFVLPSPMLPLKKTISIGVAEYKPNEPIDEFVKRADMALYAAKSSGKNKVVKAS